MAKQFIQFTMCALFICLIVPQVSAQIQAEVPTTNQSPSLQGFSNFLKTLPDSTSSKINDLQLTLAQAQDRLDQLQNNLVQEKNKFESSGQATDMTQLDAKLENIGYLNEEMVALTKGLLNLQSSSEIEFEIAYLEESKQLVLSELEKVSSSTQMKAISAVEQTDSKLAKEADEDLSSYDFETHPASEVKAYPPFECKTIIEDPNKSIQTTYTKLSPFFSFTPEKLQAHFQESSFIDCEAQLATKDNLYFINLEITIQTKSARDTYGGIDKGAALRIELINGTTVLAYNVKRDYGILSADEESVVYSVIFSLDSDDIKSLSKFDVDKVGIIWSTGYEDYEVYQTDFIINHINCLNKLK